MQNHWGIEEGLGQALNVIVDTEDYMHHRVVGVDTGV